MSLELWTILDERKVLILRSSLLQDVAHRTVRRETIDVNQPARLFYIGKEFVLLLSFGAFKIRVHGFLLILG